MTGLWQGPTRLAKTSGPVRQKQRVGKALKAGAMCAILAEIDASNRQRATGNSSRQQQAMVCGQQATLIVIEGQLFTLGRPSPAPVAVAVPSCSNAKCQIRMRNVLALGVAVVVAALRWTMELPLLLAAPLALWHAK